MSSGEFLGVCRCHGEHFCPTLSKSRRRREDLEREMAKLGLVPCSWWACDWWKVVQDRWHGDESMFCEDHFEQHRCTMARDRGRQKCTCGRHR